MHAINWVFWLGLASSVLSFVAFLIPKRLKEVGQTLLDDLTLRVSYYDLERVYSVCRASEGRLWISGACVCCESIGAYIIRRSIRLEPMPLWLWAVAVPLNYAAFYLASTISFRAPDAGVALKRLLAIFLVSVAAIVCLRLPDLSDTLSDKVDEIFGSAWDYVEWGIKPACIIFLMLSLYLGVVTFLLWLSKILARIASFVMWGVIANKEGAVAGLFALITLALGIVKALLSKS
jgi:hypothetical protein